MKKETEMVSAGTNEVVAAVDGAIRKSGLYEQQERFSEALRSSGYFEMQERLAAAVRSSGMNDVAERLREATASVTIAMAAVQLPTIEFPDVPTVELPELPTIELPELTAIEVPELTQGELLATVNVAETRAQNLLGDISTTLQKLFAWLQPKMAPAAEAVSRLMNWLAPKVAPVASAVSSFVKWLAPKLEPVLEATRQIGAWVAPRIGPCLETLRIIAEDFREARQAAWERLTPDHKRCFAAVDAAARGDQTWLRGFVKELRLGIKGTPWRDLVQLATFHIFERDWLFSQAPLEYIRRKVRDDHYGRRPKINGVRTGYGFTLDARLQWQPKSPLFALLEKEDRKVVQRSLSSIGPARRQYFEERLWNGRRPREAAAALGLDCREAENAAEHFRRWAFNVFGWKLSEDEA